MSHVGMLNAHSGQVKATSMFVMTSLIMALNVAEADSKVPDPIKENCAVVEHENAKTIADYINVASSLSAALDKSYALIISRKADDSALLDHPFATIASVLDQAVKRLLPMKRRGEMSVEERLYLQIIAEARQKANRNMHMIKQITVEPSVFKSSIDRDGLVALSLNARQAHAALRS